ncbi:G7QAJ4_9DELT Transcriptional regulator, MucR family [Clostridium botulinum B str. Osaka05]|uniref:G7QAJ4_9DELT Transcriptional regulator, MucR family n=1 Tax=Clostridium botulinum B str. Osaka05 TaxID=1407017 RepID=A0A060N9P0_CLOBO|nr:hypothetical protein [Clostridium botulinum]BAO05009.1 G7QAJ4_9DELT Transcriptional regulator, MucR family [Clostridium botulinum B str. Osaka05]
MNTVNSDNFNETMEGYLNYALDFVKSELKDKNFTEEQIGEIISLFNCGINWATSGMTMEDARRYKRRIKEK